MPPGGACDRLPGLVAPSFKASPAGRQRFAQPAIENSSDGSLVRLHPPRQRLNEVETEGIQSLGAVPSQGGDLALAIGRLPGR